MGRRASKSEKPLLWRLDGALSLPLAAFWVSVLFIISRQFPAACHHSIPSTKHVPLQTSLAGQWHGKQTKTQRHTTKEGQVPPKNIFKKKIGVTVFVTRG